MKPFFGELIDFALFSLSQPLPVCEAFDGLTVGGAPIKFSIVKLPVADVKSEEWKSHEIDHHQLKDCIFLGYGESDEGFGDGQLRMQDHIQGDSGAPLICRDENGEERIYGILSNSEISIPGQKKSCFSDKMTFMFDVLTDIRYILPLIRSNLLEMGKLDELIEDYEKCGYQSDQQIQTPESVLSPAKDLPLDERQATNL
uniref:Peptidase S1 domain-containing protein n=1 Tax=Ascaris lumbricoides TaxID=6252 RepID=A0A0M3IUZ8_ASCLU